MLACAVKEGVAPLLPQLSRFPFLLLNKGMRSRSVFEQFTKTNNFDFEVAIQSDDFSSIFTLACQGLGICISPKTFLTSIYREYTSSDSPVEILPLGPDTIPVTLRLYHKGDELSSPPALYLRELIIDACTQIGSRTAIM